MAALPPEFKLEDDDEGPEDQVLKTLMFVAPEPPSLTEFAWHFARSFMMFLALTSLGAYILMECWNTLTEVTTLPEITWREAFCTLILLRIVALATISGRN